jgi:hypothetical protein
MKLTHGKSAPKLVIGGEARVELLPGEIAAKAQAHATRRALVGVVFVAVAISAGGFAFATMIAGQSAAALAAEQDRTTALLREQAKFIEVSQVEDQLATATAAERVGASTEIDWRSYMETVQAKLPDGVEVVGFAADSATPLQPYAQSKVPLEGQRIATLVFTATGADLPRVEQWLDALETLQGFADATPGSVSVTDDGSYAATITMHINSDALSNRFAPAVDETATQEDESE